MTATLPETLPAPTAPPSVERPVKVRWPRPTTGARAVRCAPSRRDVATQLAKRRLLAERLAALIAANVAQLKQVQRDGRSWMCPGDDETVFLGAERIGYVSMPETGHTLSISDEDAFFAWLIDEGHSSEIVWRIEMTAAQFQRFLGGEAAPGSDAPATPSVRPAFWKLLTDAVKTTGRTVHPRTGEVSPIPGLAVVATNPSPAFNKAPGVKHPKIACAARSGDLSAADVASLLDLPTPTVQSGDS
ncbi:hypothetical protein [Streptosporangium sp. NPDC051022]|uniref:hypothetical protein n=1 Tax=Streptosporangium sp. NPDC051022 TaxID=3155752 RepID=UPI003416DA86